MRGKAILATMAAGCVFIGVFSARPSAAQLIIINKLEDVNLGVWSGAGRLRQVMRHCVGTNVAGAAYSVTITGPAIGNNFVATNGIDSPQVRIHYRDGNGSGWVRMRPGQSRNFNGETTATCISGNPERQRIRTTVVESELTGITSGNYSTTLTILVAPL